MYGVRVEYHTEDQDGEVRKRVETLVLAVQNGERVITMPKVTIVGDPPFIMPTNGRQNISSLPAGVAETVVVG